MTEQERFESYVVAMLAANKDLRAQTDTSRRLFVEDVMKLARHMLDVDRTRRISPKYSTPTEARNEE